MVELRVFLGETREPRKGRTGFWFSPIRGQFLKHCSRTPVEFSEVPPRDRPAVHTVLLCVPLPLANFLAELGGAKPLSFFSLVVSLPSFSCCKSPWSFDSFHSIFKGSQGERDARWRFSRHFQKDQGKEGLEARKPTQNPEIPKQTPRSRELFRRVRVNFCLLPCDTSQGPNGNCSEKLVEMNFFILGGFFRVDFPPLGGGQTCNN